jgi:hypothetical protein
MTPFGAWFQVEWIVREPHLEKVRFGGALLSSFCPHRWRPSTGAKEPSIPLVDPFGIDNDGAIGSGSNRS